MEQKETIDTSPLQQISEALKIPAEAIKNFDEGQVVIIIASTIIIEKDAYIGNPKPIFNINSVKKWLKALEEIKKLNAELLKVKDEQSELLEHMM